MQGLFAFTSEYLGFVFSLRLTELAILQVCIGWLPIIAYLIVTKHASFADDQLGYDKPFCIRCADTRWKKDLSILGGPAAMSFGMSSYLLALWCQGNGWSIAADWFGANAKMRFFICILNLTILTVRLYRHRKEVQRHPGMFIMFDAHLNGCGHVTSRGPFFLLYWFQIICQALHWNTATVFIVHIRDFETLVSVVFSLPTLPLINLISLLTTGRGTLIRVIKLESDHSGN